MTAKDHNRLIGIFHLIQGGLQVFAGIMIGLIYGFLGVAFKANARHVEEEMMGTIFIVLAFIVAPIMLILAGINITAGYKLYKEKAGARIWGIVASILCIWSIPLGTALGVYGLWFTFSEEGKSYYLTDNSYAPASLEPPPPNNWQ